MFLIFKVLRHFLLSMLTLVHTHKIKIARTNLNQFDIGRKY